MNLEYRDLARDVLPGHQPTSEILVKIFEFDVERKILLETGKLKEVKSKTINVHLDILGIYEIRWTGNGDFIQDDVRIIRQCMCESRGNGVVLKGKLK